MKRPQWTEKRTYVLAGILILWAVGGCGSSPSTSTATDAATPSTPAPPARSVSITFPREGQHLRDAVYVIRGRARPASAAVVLSLLGPDVRHYEVHTTAEHGRWKARMRLYRSQKSSIMADLLTSDDFDLVDIKVGKPKPPPESAYDRRVRLIVKKGAIGMSLSELHKQLGAPDHKQDVAGQIMWYYQVNDNLYQLVIVGGAVSQINSY